MKLLNIDANPKTIKGQARGYMTAVLYLAPYRLSGVNVCPTAEDAGCWRTCLNVAGRGGIPSAHGGYIGLNSGPHLVPDNSIQRARIARTRLYLDSPTEFFNQLYAEIFAFVRRAERKGLTPCVRLNGTSDIPFERRGWAGHANMMQAFPHVQFYDYTKLPARASWGHMPVNYRLSLSWSGASQAYRAQVEAAARLTGAPLVVVTRDGSAQWADLAPIMERAGCTHIVNGDAHDLRFLEKPHALVLLKAKGLARRESNGFILGSSDRHTAELGSNSCAA